MAKDYSHNFIGTEKQYEIIGLILDAADQGEHVTLAQLKARLSYGSTVTHQAVSCSVKILEAHGLLIRRYGKELLSIEEGKGKTQYVFPTLETYKLMRREPVEIEVTPGSV